MNWPTRTREPADAVRSQAASERLVAELNSSVVRHLSSASFALTGLAARLEDPESSRQLLESVDDLDITITRVRAILLRAFAADAVADDSPLRAQPDVS